MSQRIVKDPLVVYHGNCQDGFTAAWVMRRWLMDPERVTLKFTAPNDSIEFFAAMYPAKGSPLIIPYVHDRDVWMVDFSASRLQLEAINANARSFVVLDHHKTAQAECEGLPFCTFDMNRSGAMLAWDWCFPYQEAPWLVNYVQDRDLWRHALPWTAHINAFLQTARQNFEQWDDIHGSPWTYVAERGSGALDAIDHYVREMKLQAQRVTFAGYPDIPVVNAPYINASELVGVLAKDALFAVGWFQRGDGMYQFSLRSRGDFDVSTVAKRYGGGGHKNAAGFTVEVFWNGVASDGSKDLQPQVEPPPEGSGVAMVTPKPLEDWSVVDGYTDAQLLASIRKIEVVGHELGSALSLPMIATYRRLLAERDKAQDEAKVLATCLENDPPPHLTYAEIAARAAALAYLDRGGE